MRLLSPSLLDGQLRQMLFRIDQGAAHSAARHRRPFFLLRTAHGFEESIRLVRLYLSPQNLQKLLIIAGIVERTQSLRYDPEREITICCGSTEAMMSAMMAIINPGDETVVFEPFYENYGPDAILSGASPRFLLPRHGRLISPPGCGWRRRSTGLFTIWILPARVTRRSLRSTAPT